MWNFFDTLIEYVKLFFDFVVGIIEGLAGALETLATGVASTLTVIGIAPQFLSTSALIALSIVVVNYVIGRDNS